PLHALRAMHDACHDAAPSFRIVLVYSQEGGPRSHGTERGAQVVAEDADELIPKQVALNRIAIHRLRHGFVDGFVESADTGEVRFSAFLIESQHGRPERAKSRQHCPEREAVLDTIVSVKRSRGLHGPRAAAAARL